MLQYEICPCCGKPKRPQDARNLEGLLADAVITSPPYERSLVQPESGIDADKLKHPFGPNSQFARPQAYTRPVDAVVSSPPYEGGGHHEGAFDTWGGVQRVSPHLADSYTPDKHNRENIGNQKGAAYWESMRQVYGQCYAVLKPGGVMALVVKGFTRDGKYVDLPSQTVELCESLGLRLFDRWARELWSLSFWRVLQKRRDPAAFDERLMFEEVLAFRKPADAEAREPNVDCVLTSPPYEGFSEGGVDGSAARLQAKIQAGLVDKKAARALTRGSMVQNPRYTRPQETKPMEVKRE